MVAGIIELSDAIVLQQSGFETEALVSAVFVFLISLLVGAAAIHLAAKLLIDRDVGFRRAIVTALIGAIVYTLVGLFLGWIPLLGPLLMLLAWVGVINWQYPGGWGSAIAIGVVAWLVAVLLIYALAQLDFVTSEALGVPGT